MRRDRCIARSLLRNGRISYPKVEPKPNLATSEIPKRALRIREGRIAVRHNFLGKPIPKSHHPLQASLPDFGFNIDPKRLHQNRTVPREISTPRLKSGLPTFRRLSEYRVCRITSRQITSGHELAHPGGPEALIINAICGLPQPPTKLQRPAKPAHSRPTASPDQQQRDDRNARGDRIVSCGQLSRLRTDRQMSGLRWGCFVDARKSATYVNLTF